MIILRQKEFGRTGLNKEQAKEWFKGGLGKVNKSLKQLDDLKVGAETLTKYAKNKSDLLKASASHSGVENNRLSNLYAKNHGHIKSRKDKKNPNVIQLGRYIKNTK